MDSDLSGPRVGGLIALAPQTETEVPSWRHRKGPPAGDSRPAKIQRPPSMCLEAPRLFDQALNKPLLRSGSFCRVRGVWKTFKRSRDIILWDYFCARGICIPTPSWLFPATSKVSRVLLLCPTGLVWSEATPMYAPVFHYPPRLNQVRKTHPPPPPSNFFFKIVEAVA